MQISEYESYAASGGGVKAVVSGLTGWCEACARVLVTGTRPASDAAYPPHMRPSIYIFRLSSLGKDAAAKSVYLVYGMMFFA